MAYIRKTRDEWRLFVNYGFGHGWEYAIGANSRKEILERKKEYNENCPQYPVKILRKRVKIEDQVSN